MSVDRVISSRRMGAHSLHTFSRMSLHSVQIIRSHPPQTSNSDDLPPQYSQGRNGTNISCAGLVRFGKSVFATLQRNPTSFAGVDSACGAAVGADVVVVSGPSFAVGHGVLCSPFSTLAGSLTGVVCAS